MKFTLTNRVVTSVNDASADNLSFTLAPAPIPAITAYGRVASGWQVELTTSTQRFYVLERSENLTSWTAATLPVPGNVQPTVLMDTNTPPGQAFYRVVRRADSTDQPASSATSHGLPKPAAYGAAGAP